MKDRFKDGTKYGMSLGVLEVCNDGSMLGSDEGFDVGSADGLRNGSRDILNG